MDTLFDARVRFKHEHTRTHPHKDHDPQCCYGYDTVNSTTADGADRAILFVLEMLSEHSQCKTVLPEPALGILLDGRSFETVL